MTSKPVITKKLRSGGACQSVENIFQSEHYQHILPPDVYNRLAGIPTLNCDKISQFVFEPTSFQARNLKAMRAITVGPAERLPEEFHNHESSEIKKNKRK